MRSAGSTHRTTAGKPSQRASLRQPYDHSRYWSFVDAADLHAGMTRRSAQAKRPTASAPRSEIRRCGAGHSDGRTHVVDAVTAIEGTFYAKRPQLTAQTQTLYRKFLQWRAQQKSRQGSKPPPQTPPPPPSKTHPQPSSHPPAAQPPPPPPPSPPFPP